MRILPNFLIVNNHEDGRKNKTELSQNERGSHKEKKSSIRMRQYALDDNGGKTKKEEKQK